MKKATHCFALVFLTFIFMIGGTACMKNPAKPESTETSGASSFPEVPAKSDREIVEAVWNEFHGTDSVWDGERIDYIGECMKLAEVLSGKLFGSITSEEDAKEKATAAWAEAGETLIHQPINAKLYEEYDAWLLWGSSPPPQQFTDSDGKEFYVDVPHSVPYVIMRASDGKVLAFGII